MNCGACGAYVVGAKCAYCGSLTKEKLNNIRDNNTMIDAQIEKLENKITFLQTAPGKKEVLELKIKNYTDEVKLLKASKDV
nr:hypothetical protein 2 [Paracoccaceae bacterium]